MRNRTDFRVGGRIDDWKRPPLRARHPLAIDEKKYVHAEFLD
jgi:hypothetical protein